MDIDVIVALLGISGGLRVIARDYEDEGFVNLLNTAADLLQDNAENEEQTDSSVEAVVVNEFAQAMMVDMPDVDTWHISTRDAIRQKMLESNDFVAIGRLCAQLWLRDSL